MGHRPLLVGYLSRHLRRRAALSAAIEAEADALIGAHGDDAYQYVRELCIAIGSGMIIDSAHDEAFYQRVRGRIAEKIGRAVGQDTTRD